MSLADWLRWDHLRELSMHISPKDLVEFFDNGVVSLHIVSSDGTILRANKAELEFLGYSAEEYVGHHIAEFHVDRPVIDDIIARLARGEKLERVPARLRAKDGSIKHTLISTSARFQEGRFVSTRCFTLDATEAKLADALPAEWRAKQQSWVPSWRFC
jgi:PAS domain S-box-containing protein